MAPLRYIFSNNICHRYHNLLPSTCTNIVRFSQQSFLSQLTGANRETVQDVIEQGKKLYYDVVPKIGLEVHAQLKIKSKLFSQGGNSNQAPSNSQLDLFDISLPGTLPKLNGNALKAAILSGLGLNCTIQSMIHFDRKNYFYTDMPAGYQITQFNNPVAKDGFLDFIVTAHHRSLVAHSQRYDVVKHLYFEDRKDVDDISPYMKRSHIKQIQLEQDSAKTLHYISPTSQQELYNLVDYNRSGAGLIEIVFEPDLTNHHEAASLIKELAIVLKALGTCDCELQLGSLRVDANVSIKSISGQPIEDSARVELKNLNSLKSLSKGISFEIQRQAALIQSMGIVTQETRTFDTKSNKTVPLRIKEESVDYRYVPEPSIPPFKIGEEMIEEIRRDLPSELPCKIRDHLISEYNIDLALVAEVMDEPSLSDYFFEVMRNKAYFDANIVADFLIYTTANLRRVVEPPLQVDYGNSEYLQRLNPEKMQTLFDMMFQDEISFATAYEVIKHIFVNNDKSDPRKIVNDFGWYQINDQAKVNELCIDLIKNMKNIPKKYSKKGDKKYLRMMLDKICEMTDSKISVRRAIDSLDELLEPPHTRNGNK